MAFVNFYNKYRLSPTVIYVSSQELVNITKKVIGNGGAPLLKINANINAQTNGIAAGVVIGSYWNKVVGREIPLIVHPNLPAGRSSSTPQNCRMRSPTSPPSRAC